VGNISYSNPNSHDNPWGLPDYCKSRSPRVLDTGLWPPAHHLIRKEIEVVTVEFALDFADVLRKDAEYIITTYPKCNLFLPPHVFWTMVSHHHICPRAL
jgi:hypothetical protein